MQYNYSHSCIPQSQSVCGDKPTGVVVVLWHSEDPLAALSTGCDRDSWRMRGQTRVQTERDLPVSQASSCSAR